MLEFARAGCDVALTYRADAGGALGTAEEARGLGADVQAWPCDLARPEDVESLARAILEGGSRLDVLVHNAAAYHATPLAGAGFEDAVSLHVVNAVAPLILSARLAPRLARSALAGGGSIIALADIHAMGRPRRGFTPYTMSKAALVEMVRSLARELAPSVRVNAVAPGVVAFGESGEDADPAVRAAYLARVPMGRAGTPEEAANAVRWLALEATYVTGHILRLDGGRFLA